MQTEFPNEEKDFMYIIKISEGPVLWLLQHLNWEKNK